MVAVNSKTRKQSLVQAATINRVNSKVGNFLGYLVKSNSTEDYYEVTYNESANRYECNCAAFSKCCHIRSVEQVQVAKVEIAMQQEVTRHAPLHESEGRLPQEVRQSLYNWSQSQAGDAMEREYNQVPKYNYNSLNYPSGAYRPLDR